MAEEIHELHEHAEEAAHHNLAQVTVTMAVLAVLVAAASLLGHRAHTEELLSQTRSTDQWAYYQAKDIRRHSYELFLDELSVFSLRSSDAAAGIRDKYGKQVARYRHEEREIQAEARAAEHEVEIAERRANRFDLAEVLLEAALVICSITLLTKKRVFWAIGSFIGLAGVLIGLAGLFVG